MPKMDGYPDEQVDTKLEYQYIHSHTFNIELERERFESETERTSKFIDSETERISKIIDLKRELIQRIVEEGIERIESFQQKFEDAMARAEEEEEVEGMSTFRMSRLDATESVIKAIAAKRNAGLINHTKKQSQGDCEEKVIDRHALRDCFEALKRRFDDLDLKLDRIAGMIEIHEEEALEEETSEGDTLEETMEEVETLAEACGQLQSELDATIQRNELLESRIELLQEQVAAFEIRANNNIQHNKLLEGKMKSLEERVATLEMVIKATSSDETYSQMASVDFWESRDDDSNVKWDSNTEEDEW